MSGSTTNFKVTSQQDQALSANYETMLRDLFAGLAMTYYLRCIPADEVAKRSFEMADAMMAAREKK